MCKIEINVGDWYDVRFKTSYYPSNKDVRYYEVLEKNDNYDLFVLSAIKNDGTIEKVRFTGSAVRYNIKNKIWVFDKNILKQKEKQICKKCGKEGDHIGMTYYIMNNECRIW